MKRHGLSLTEVLIAAAIVGALAAVSVPNALAARVSGNDSTAKVLLGGLAERQSGWFQVNFAYWPWAVPGGGDASSTVVFEAGDSLGQFIPGLTRPTSYNVFFYVLHHEASLTQRYCVAVQHHRAQSNAWVWTSGSSEYLRVDRSVVDSNVGDSLLDKFSVTMATACAGAVDYD
jgi:prepilin-type N-terminal cleavage/methylation domain-containing protein